MNMKTLFLLATSFGVSIIGLLYGVSPKWFARKFLGVPELGLNFSHILRAVMCLYLGLSLFWLYSAFNAEYTNPAILSIMVFGGGLLLGRIISFFVDGKPSPLLILYIVMEFALVPFAYWIFRLPE
jgi:hypothetical protein